MAQEFSIMELDQINTYLHRAFSWIPRSHPVHTAYIHLLATMRLVRFQLSGQKEDLDKSIVHYTEAIFLPPSWGFYLNVVQVFFELVHSLFRRSKEFKQPKDVKCAVEYLRYLRGLPLDTFEVSHELVTTLLVQALDSGFDICRDFERTRADFFPNPEYLEKAISRFRTLLGSSSLDNNFRYGVTYGMESLAKKRFENFGLTEALQEARSYTSEMINLASSSAPGTFDKSNDRRKSEVFANKSPRLPQGPPSTTSTLNVLRIGITTKFSRTNDIMDLEEVIKCRRALLASADTSHPLGSRKALSLGSDLFKAFECSNKMEYLDESITVHRGVLEMKSARSFHFTLILQLSTSLLARGHKQDFDEAIELFPLAVNDEFTKAPDRYTFSCAWAFLARKARHPSVSVAYEKAMSLMQSSLVSAPTLQIQHDQLVAMQSSAAICRWKQGRALLWSEMRGLRNSMDHLSRFNSSLATKLTAINQDLESLTMSVAPSGIIGISDGESQVDDEMDPFGRLVVKQQKLLEKRDVLISQIQEVPGFGDFLKTPSFQTIRNAASHGPVVIINHSEWRSDILILLRNSPPSLIPTTKDFYHLANELKDRLVVARKEGLDSERYGRALRSVLEGLYKLVGRPVIDRLCALGVPEQSRIWWCPTSVFCSLPLHAMGPIPSNDGVKRYFSDLYIPSYTPTLSALIESRKPSPKTSYQPSLLLVANPDESLPGAFGEMEIIQSLKSRVPVATLCGKNATPAGVVERLRDHGLVHFVCHGTLETGKPFDASFKLYEDERLTLLDIVRSRLPAAEFAFLAACHTAELTDESIADEGLHLTAAVQYCGFRSVVGTMWEMADIDGCEIAENFYKSMFSGNGQGVGYHLRSARALRDATRKMRRKKGMTLERWVNFVHYAFEGSERTIKFQEFSTYSTSLTHSALSTLPTFDADQFSAIQICVLKPSSIANGLPDLQGHSCVSAFSSTSNTFFSPLFSLSWNLSPLRTYTVSWMGGMNWGSCGPLETCEGGLVRRRRVMDF
ncbi:CHAT domain-containing protein [Multifurca ochricompacta]|uniref:CHAT domain-containing protein n=1 Tax=Multifurca ochricompacta TaxID=376703 RepID=A0AAD4M3K7_9AGAM|nr:CHAT domain-containing protein [Multifurca ochricompacta]